MILSLPFTKPTPFSGGVPHLLREKLDVAPVHVVEVRYVAAAHYVAAALLHAVEEPLHVVAALAYVAVVVHDMPHSHFQYCVELKVLIGV